MGKYWFHQKDILKITRTTLSTLSSISELIISRKWKHYFHLIPQEAMIRIIFCPLEHWQKSIVALKLKITVVDVHVIKGIIQNLFLFLLYWGVRVRNLYTPVYFVVFFFWGCLCVICTTLLPCLQFYNRAVQSID